MAFVVLRRREGLLQQTEVRRRYRLQRFVKLQFGFASNSHLYISNWIVKGLISIGPGLPIPLIRHFEPGVSSDFPTQAT